VIDAAIELPPDNRSDEITLQVVSCTVCYFRGMAVYQESRRGALGSESWDHTGYKFDKTLVSSLAKTIRSCPRPRDHKCKCASHRLLSRFDPYGRWQLPQDFEISDVFPMRRS
jgi:hypothetical protein